jgi:site-specific DNA-methyltransferase (adenine-specific)
MSKIELFNEDCMVVMSRYPDKYFDLACVDPPYGINFGEFNRTNKLSNGKTIKADKYKNSKWDGSIPSNEYFNELERISSNRIIWGGNYFHLPPTQCFIFWYKHNPVDNFSDGELAWTSFKKPAKCFDYQYYGNIEGNTCASTKIHPTQKPVKLYQWLLTNYAKPGQKIFDSHLGSASSAIAAHYFGVDFVGCELDKEYYDAAVNRFNHATAQVDMFAL